MENCPCLSSSCSGDSLEASKEGPTFEITSTRCWAEASWRTPPSTIIIHIKRRKRLTAQSAAFWDVCSSCICTSINTWNQEKEVSNLRNFATLFINWIFDVLVVQSNPKANNKFTEINKFHTFYLLTFAIHVAMDFSTTTHTYEA